MWRGMRLVMITLAGVLFGAHGIASAALSVGPAYAKFYVVVASYQGGPENLREIAGRFLRSQARSMEILSMNVGIRQPDGGKLTDSSGLHRGWVLRLPWDAVGDGVQYGLPPTGAPAKTAGPAGGTAASNRRSVCAGTQKPGDDSNQADWAMLRISPQHAWPYSRGGGVAVAVIDSGVDATLPALDGHVSAGADIVAGSGRGDVDCLGTGTAMAAIIAGQANAGVAVGMAPDAAIAPVRIAPSKGLVAESDQVTAIRVAVVGGASVIALGGYVDPSRPAVAAAITLAAKRDVVVVTGAAAGVRALDPGLLRVGAIDINGASSGGYPAGAADVVAPGVDVTSLGITGTGQVRHTGNQYAVAFAAGEAALVRSRFPNLTAAQVVRRIEATADRSGAPRAQAMYGYGLIDPAAAVTRVIGEEGSGPTPVTGPPVHAAWSDRRVLALVVALALGVLLVVVVFLRIRRMVRFTAAEPAGETGTDPVGSPQLDDTVKFAGEPVAPWQAVTAMDTDDAGAGARSARTEPVAVLATSGAHPRSGAGQEDQPAMVRWWRHGSGGE